LTVIASRPAEKLLRRECRVLARWSQGKCLSAGLEELDAATVVGWYRRNKVPLIGIARQLPPHIAEDGAFRAALAIQLDWFAVQRAEYRLVQEAWRAEGIESLMIKSAGNYPSFPYNSDNLDLLVRPEQGQAARDVLRRFGYVELRNIEEPWKYLFRKFVGGRCVSAIHVHEQVAWEVVFIDHDQLWARMRAADDDPLVNIPSPEDAILINLAHACYENKRLRLNDLLRVRHAMQALSGAADWEYMERTAAARGWLDGLAFMVLVYAQVEPALFGSSLVADAQQQRFAALLRGRPALRRRLDWLRSASDVDLPLRLGFWFCKRLYYRKILADPRRSFAQRGYDVLATALAGIQLKSNVRPQPGTIVSLSGIDGSGKTAHATALVEAFRVCGLNVHYVWSRGGSSGLVGAANRLRSWLSRDDATADQTQDSLTRRRGRLASPLARFVWAWLVASEQVATFALRARLPALLGRITVTDRYVYDTAVEMDASLPTEARWSRWAIEAMLRWAPRPQTGYVLDLAPETARERKTEEAWHPDLDHERRQYQALAQRFGLRILSNQGPFEASNDRLVREVMTSYMAGWETRLNALFLANPSQKNIPDRVWTAGRSR
jgi:thymidylate kinase